MVASEDRMAIRQEVRFAVVMYGGVSLAIYINGVAQELFRMVRATAGAEGGEPLVGQEQLRGTESVYRELGHTTNSARLLSQGVQAKFVQDLLGHATIAITLGTYSHVLPGIGCAAAGTIDEALG